MRAAWSWKCAITRGWKVDRYLWRGPAAQSMNELLWDASYYAIRDTINMREHVKEGQPATIGVAYENLPAARMPEESSTVNFVRNLGLLGRNLKNVTAVLHNRPLEG